MVYGIMKAGRLSKSERDRLDRNAVAAREGRNPAQRVMDGSRNQSPTGWIIGVIFVVAIIETIFFMRTCPVRCRQTLQLQAKLLALTRSPLSERRQDVRQHLVAGPRVKMNQWHSNSFLPSITNPEQEKVFPTYSEVGIAIGGTGAICCPSAWSIGTNCSRL